MSSPYPSSSRMASGSATPQPLIALQAPKVDESANLAKRLNRLLHKPKYAHFEVTVKLEELGNVPFLGGTFQAEYKFVGRSPHGKDPSLRNKPSLPNIKLNQATASSSSSHSLLPSALTLTPSMPPSPLKNKHSSTPLRQSTHPPSSSDIHLDGVPRSTSPEPISPAETTGRARQDSVDSGQTESSDKSSPAGSSVVYFGKPRTPSVPFPRATSNAPAVRAGTTAAASNLIDLVPRARAPNTNTSKSHEHLPLPDQKPRLLSNPVRKRTDPDRTFSSHRKGRTPARSLHDYTCTWNFTAQHTIRIPCGKPVSASGVTTPNKKEKAPILGGGPHSDSGFSLHIYSILPASSVQSGVEKPKGEKRLYGTVHMDLAPYAGRGKLSRRHLLQGCKANATVKITVEMKQVGGDAHWAAPPMTEGHHVTGVRDMINEDNLVQDLALARNSSGSSTGSSRSTGTNISAVSLASQGARSIHSLPPGYDHHLKPSDARRAPPAPLLQINGEPSPTDTPHSTSTIRPSHSDHSTTPTPHLLGNRQRLISLQQQHQSMHTRRGGYAKNHTFRNLNEPSAEAVIEALFNPRIPIKAPTHVPAESKESVAPSVGSSEGQEADGEIEGPGRWARMKLKAQNRTSSARRDRESIPA